MGAFDTQVQQAVKAGKPLPKGTDYQRGPRYGFDTLRAAVFARDNHTCQVCGKGIKEGAILRVHHLGFRTGDHTDRMSNLLTVCAECHTPQNHKEGGELWDLKPTLKPFKGATFMTMVRWDVYKQLKAMAPNVQFSITYGVVTKRKRTALNISKSHANDAYAMGNFHPKKRARTTHWKKRRRNDRALEKFYDARYIEKKPGKCEAVKSCRAVEPTVRRRGKANNRDKRAARAVKKTKNGYRVIKRGRSIRTRRYPVQSGDIVLYGNKRVVAGGTHNKGTSVKINGKFVATSKVRVLRHIGGWIQTD